ncbi:MAG: hypothetical protein ABI379_08070 [Rhodanobacter sp.]
MKSLYAMALCISVALGTNALAADSGSLNDFPPKVLPVLVQVNAHGKVTSASPSTELPPRLTRLLLENLNGWIAGPALVHGKPVSSQFIMNLALEVTPRPTGDYYANFAYVSTSPVPPGSWYWIHIDGHRLALANRNGFRGPQQNRFHLPRVPGYIPMKPTLPPAQPVPNMSGSMRSAAPPHIN